MIPLVWPFNVRTEHRPRRQLRSIFKRSEYTSFHGRVRVFSNGRGRESGEGEVGGVEATRAAASVGTGDDKGIVWTEGVGEEESSE